MAKKGIHYSVSPEKKPYKKYYGLSSVPTTWQAQRVRFKEFPRVLAVVYKTRSGWLVSNIYEKKHTGWGGTPTGIQLGDTAYKSRAGAGGYGYESKEEAIQAYIEQMLSNKRIRR